jgi:hypothetical protein
MELTASPTATSSSGAGTGVRLATAAIVALPATSNSSGITSIVLARPLFSTRSSARPS